MLYEKIDDWCERIILGLILLILTIGPILFGSVQQLHFQVLHWLILLSVVVWMVRLWIDPTHRIMMPPAAWGVLAVVSYAIGRYYYSDIEYAAREEMIKTVLYGLLFFVIINNLRGRDYALTIVSVLSCLAVLLSFYALYQFITDSDKVLNVFKPEQYLKRGTGTYICPNHLAGFLEILAPLAFAYALTSRLKHVQKILLGYSALVILVGIAVTVSRGGWIATGISMLVFFGFLVTQRQFRIPALIVLVLLAVSGTIFVVNAKTSKKRFDEMLVTGKVEDIRFKLWPAATQLWLERPLTGIGLSHFDYRFRQYRAQDIQMQADRVHNDYLNTLCDWGLIGFSLIALSFGLVYWGVFRTWKYVQRGGSDFGTSSGNRSAFVLGGAVGLLAILLHSFVDFNMHIPANAILVITLMALLSSYLRFATESYWIRLKLWLRLALTAVGVAGVGYLAIQGFNSGVEAYWLDKATNAEVYSPESLEYYEKAYAANPRNAASAHAIGELHRIKGWQGDDGYQKHIENAMKWFEISMKLNPYNGYCFMHYGMCLDYLGRTAEAGAYFKTLEKLDPNGYFAVAHQGWHRVQLGDYAAAKGFFEKSLQIKALNNPIATSYLGIVNRKLAEQAQTK